MTLAYYVHFLVQGEFKLLAGKSQKRNRNKSAKNKKTQQSANILLDVWKSWASQKRYGKRCLVFEAEAMAKVLKSTNREFYATVGID